MNEDRTEERPLHPGVDLARWEAAVGAIEASAAGELERRARASSPVIVLARWTRPVLSAAATVALLASAAILSRGRTPGEETVATSEGEVELTVAGVLMPEELSTWLMGGETESVVSLVRALEEGR